MSDAPDAYWLEVGGRSPEGDENATGASLGPFVNKEAATVTAHAIKGWTLGRIEALGLGGIDIYGTDPVTGRILAAQPDEVVRWAGVREQWVEARDENGIPTGWDPGDMTIIYDDFIKEQAA